MKLQHFPHQKTIGCPTESYHPVIIGVNRGYHNDNHRCLHWQKLTSWTWSSMKKCPIQYKRYFLFFYLFCNVIFSDISRFIEIFTHIRHWGYSVIGLSYANSPSNDERYGFNRQFSNHHHRRSSNNKARTAYITLLGNYDINAEALSLNSSCWINMLRLWKNRGDKLTWPPSH